MRAALLFIAIGCSSGAPAPTPPHVHTPPPPPQPDATTIDAAPPTAARGAACARDGLACEAGLMCAPLPNGYCTSFCGETGSACTTGGTCSETWRAGELCLASCSSDRDCRATEGYLCDPTWKTCMLPNMGAIVPRACPAAPGGRDPVFGPVDALSASAPGIYQFEPSAVVTDDGGVTSLYMTRDKIFDGNPLVVAQLAPNAAPRVAPFTSARTTHFDPWLARDAKGTLYAVWLGFDGRSEHQEIGFATSADRGTTWSKPVAAHDPGDCVGEEADCLDKPMVFVGADPKHRGAELVYVMYASGDSGLRVRVSRDRGLTFAKPVTPLAGIYGNAAISADGRLHVVTLNGGPRGAFGSADQRVEYAMSADGGATFGKAITVSGREETLPFFFSNPSVALDDRRGWIYIAYARGGRDAVWDLVVAASKDQGKTWKRTRIGDDPACAIHMVPNLAVDPTTGTLHVAWYDSRGGGRFAHATCASGAASCTQAGAINDAPFAALSTERHGSKWVGEYESLLVDDKRRVLHAVWTQPIADGDRKVSRIFHAAAKLPKR